jgi:predicted nucleic acid-binding protein
VEKVFVDTDIVLDLLSGRKPHYDFAADLFSLADQSLLRIFVSSLTFANVHHVLSKQLTATRTRKLLQKLKTVVNVLAVNDKIIELSLASDFRDFEDAIQYHTAIENSLETLLTRNLRDFKQAQISILTAQQFLKTLN